jgi:hypothetical protein
MELHLKRRFAVVEIYLASHDFNIGDEKVKDKS